MPFCVHRLQAHPAVPVRLSPRPHHSKQQHQPRPSQSASLGVREAGEVEYHMHALVRLERE